MVTGITAIPETFLILSLILFLRKFYFLQNFFRELLMENKRKVIDDYLFDLKFTVSKTGLKILCHVDLISIIHCITKIISNHCQMSGNLSDEVSWFLSSLWISQLCKPDRKKQFITNLLSKRHALT